MSITKSDAPPLPLCQGRLQPQTRTCSLPCDVCGGRLATALLHNTQLTPQSSPPDSPTFADTFSSRTSTASESVTQPAYFRRVSPRSDSFRACADTAKLSTADSRVLCKCLHSYLDQEPLMASMAHVTAEGLARAVLPRGTPALTVFAIDYGAEEAAVSICEAKCFIQPRCIRARSLSNKIRN